MNKIKKLVATMFNAKKADKNGEMLFSGLHFCTNHTGKMAGMYSLSTSVLQNEYCQKRAQNPDTICSHCYASRMTKMYKDLEKNLSRNTDLLTTSIIDPEKLPLINAHSFRLEAFGDLVNSTQVKNYFNLCRKNRFTRFALWTKNPFLIANAINDGYKKPANLTIIYSAPFTDRFVSVDEIRKHFDFVDKVFTVWTDETAAAAHGQKVNCGTKNCLECLTCYQKNNVTQINELLK